METHVHYSRFRALVRHLSDDGASLSALGLVLARVEAETGRILLSEADIADALDLSVPQARAALARLVASGAVYSLPAEQTAPNANRIGPCPTEGQAQSDRFYLSPDIAVRTVLITRH